MTLRLAELLPYASGYAVETQELLSIFEGFGGVLPLPKTAAAKHGVEVFQIETRNPHLHEEKGAEHLQLEMLAPSLSAVYHSRLCDDTTKENITGELVYSGIIKEGEKPPKSRLYKAPSDIQFNKFAGEMAEKLDLYSALAED